MNPKPKAHTLAFTLILIFALQGCSTFKLKNIAKSDTNLATDQHIQQVEIYLRRLTVKLYKRNPSELLKALQPHTVDERLEQLFGNKEHIISSELNNKEEIDAMELTFSTEFEGDRVFALMAGVTGMIRHSYNYNKEMFLLDNLDPEKLLKSARNIEVMAWKLGSAFQDDGKPFLITHTRNGVIDNLSFERLYGKIIGQQYILGKVIADKESRSINFIIHSGASMVFLPF